MFLACIVEFASRCGRADREATALTSSSLSVEVGGLLRRLDTNLGVPRGDDDVLGSSLNIIECESDRAHIDDVLLVVEASIVVPNSLSGSRAVLHKRSVLSPPRMLKIRNERTAKVHKPVVLLQVGLDLGPVGWFLIQTDLRCWPESGRAALSRVKT